MTQFSLHQGRMTANLSNVFYHPDEGFQEDNTWHVAAESVSADSDTKLTDGAATIRHGDLKFAVNIVVLDIGEPADEENEETENGEPACNIEIKYAGGPSELAVALGLL